MWQTWRDLFEWSKSVDAALALLSLMGGQPGPPGAAGAAGAVGPVGPAGPPGPGGGVPIGTYDCLAGLPATVPGGGGRPSGPTLVRWVAPTNAEAMDDDDGAVDPLGYRLPAIGFVQNKPDATHAIVQYQGELGGFAGLVPGCTYWASSTPGEMTNVVPAVPGDIQQRLGFAKTATVFMAQLDRDIIVL